MNFTGSQYRPTLEILQMPDGWIPASPRVDIDAYVNANRHASGGDLNILSADDFR